VVNLPAAGPGDPDEAGISMALIREMEGKVPIFGVCLGLQSMFQIYGGTVSNAPRIMHGKVSPVYHDGKGWLLALFDLTFDLFATFITLIMQLLIFVGSVFAGLPQGINCARSFIVENKCFILSFYRYHSLCGIPSTLPDCLEVPK
jgi:anthranilate/para-aminobenzoate synthase component II